MNLRIIPQIFAPALMLIACSSPLETPSSEVLPAETSDSVMPDTARFIEVEESAVSRPSYDPSTDPENKEMYALYAPYVKSEYMNRERVSGSQDSIQCFVTYLGLITDLEDQTKYDVVTEFCTVKTADSMHGNSKLAFVNMDLNYARVYYLNSRNELPVAIEDNALMFSVTGVKKGLQFKGGLPQMLCIPDSGCYD